MSSSGATSARGDARSRSIALAVRATAHVDSDRSALHWSPLAAVRGAVDEIFGDLGRDTLDAIRMAAGELAENVIKYGEATDSVPGHLSLDRTHTHVEIRTTNKITSETRAADLMERIRRISGSSDLQSAFVERMTEIVADPTQESTALGLLRVAYEGLFELSATYANATIIVVATRSLR